jgi:2-hydroxy-3-oxopropionate reductase
MTTLATTGFIGLGVMGRPMAGHVQRAGYPLVIVDFEPPLPQELIEGGAAVVATPRAVAESCDVIILMLPDTPDVELVLFGENGVLKGLTPGKTVVDMSSISPAATVQFAERIEAAGCRYLDAPVSGGAPRAISGELTIMVGGPADIFEAMEPCFSTMGATITHIGVRNGDGQVCKVANQIMVGMMTQAVAEGLLYASKAGADAGKVREALMGGAANSIILENHGKRMLERNFTESFRVELQQKDLGLAVEASRELGMMLPGATMAWQLYNACRAAGDEKNDSISILKVLEQMAGHELKGS